MQELAKENIEKAQFNMKTWYDQKATKRSFNVGDKVLAMLPVPGNTLKARFYGPYVVNRKISELDYEIETPGRRKAKQLCHINMLKLYHERETECNTKPVLANVVVENDNNDNELYDESEPMNGEVENDETVCGVKIQNSHVLSNLEEKL